MQEPIVLKQQYKNHVALIQFTDTHILASANQDFEGVDTTATLAQVINHAKTHHWPPDAVLMTGDLAHDPCTPAYARLLKLLSEIDRPVFCLPGNHDAPDIMHRLLQTADISTAKTILIGNWIIFMLDSCLPGSHAGYLDEEELELLDSRLDQYSGLHALICVHHQPVLIGSPWMDKMGLNNPDALFAVTDRHSQVRGVLWGHIHQEFMSKRRDMLLMASPSTNIQFAPRSEFYRRDDKRPGYRLLHLKKSGEIMTEVIRI
jgi:3',5'-cyclic-AMP phosphodiesterase